MLLPVSLAVAEHQQLTHAVPCCELRRMMGHYVRLLAFFLPQSRPRDFMQPGICTGHAAKCQLTGWQEWLGQV